MSRIVKSSTIVVRVRRHARVNAEGFGRLREARPKAAQQYDEMSFNAQYNINYESTSTPVYAAKEYFDELYGDRFGSDWKNLRCALLSPPKKVAVVTDSNANLEQTLESIGAQDILLLFRRRAEKLLEIEDENIAKLRRKLALSVDEQDERDEPTGGAVEDAQLVSQLNRFRLARDQLAEAVEFASGLSVYATGVENFSRLPVPLPTGSVQRDFFKADLADVFCSLCQAPSPSSSVLFLNTSSSLVPIVYSACPDSHLTVNLPDHVRANLLTTSLREQFGDTRGSIAERVAYAHDSNVMPEEEAWDEYDMNPRIQMFQHDSVLVDAPSMNDRVSLSALNHSNVFHPINTHIRQTLPGTQKDLLKKAIQLCRPGGTVTYTNCTMSHLQNEYVVQAAVRELLTEYQITVRSVPLHLVAFALPEVSTYDHSKLGQLVVPRLGQNYGPRYICKLIIE